MSEERVVPFHCPFCGGEDLRPYEHVDEAGDVTSPHGSWECRACLRAFKLTSLGMVRRKVQP